MWGWKAYVWTEGRVRRWKRQPCSHVRNTRLLGKVPIDYTSHDAGHVPRGAGQLTSAFVVGKLGTVSVACRVQFGSGTVRKLMRYLVLVAPVVVEGFPNQGTPDQLGVAVLYL